eukprot:UN04247
MSQISHTTTIPIHLSSHSPTNTISAPLFCPLLQITIFITSYFPSFLTAP